MRVLVTGREGQLARSLAERSAAIPGLSLETVGRPDLDLEDPGSIEAAISAAAPDVVVNAAAYTAVDQAEDEPERAFRINAAAAGEVAAAARRAGARVVQVSTDYVFDGTGQGAYAESAATCPLGVYGRSKLEGEQRVAEAAPDHVILRTAWVYSANGRNFVRTMLGAAARRDELNVVADQRGSPTAAGDLADGILALAAAWRERPRLGLGGVYHLAGAGEASWFDFATAIFEEAARHGLPTAAVKPIRTADWPTRAARPANSVLDSGRFAADFGYRAPPWRRSTAAVVAELARRSETSQAPR
ncbi:MAG TPA: dTDP-4-dehydrorhamnose reductase [Allosphingosinicella sp.]|jgi:dTDP-4-dehydrorhamnose reductase|nr:dTDP-4-dehydrorhamnose reductase [Allosphingosinicella sp.]